MPRTTKNTGRLLSRLRLQAKLAESEARREVRLFRKVATTAAAELGAAFERLGAARARVDMLKAARGRK